MKEVDQDAPFPEHKLCGFILAVVSISHLNRQEQQDEGATKPASLSPGAACSLIETAADAGFLAEDGTLLLPIPVEGGNAFPVKDVVTYSPSSPVTRKRRRSGIGLVKGSLSVVYQLHALVANKCLEARAKIVAVSDRGDGNVRAVILVDLYLPMAAWSGWQFPKSGALAASIFRHVSCNWKMRASLYACNGGEKSLCEEDIWHPSSCHVLGCKFHIDMLDSSKNKLFNLHEVFKGLPGIVIKEVKYSSRVIPESASNSRGIWDISDDILTVILSMLGPRDLINVASSCRHLRLLASNTIPYLKLKLFPHQQAAIEWMLHRERDPRVLQHPAFLQFETEDGFKYFVNGISGQISSDILPTISDFRGGMFCDEPGLGKTVTALSLILKTRGNWARPPNGVDVIWCMHNHNQRYGYYELSLDATSNRSFLSSCRIRGQNVQNEVFAKKKMLDIVRSDHSEGSSLRLPFNLRSSSGRFRKLEESETNSNCLQESKCYRGPAHVQEGSFDKKHLSGTSNGNKSIHMINKKTSLNHSARNNDFRNISRKKRKCDVNVTDSSDTWVQCDACKKWRRLPETSIPNVKNAWFCSMNSDHLRQSCRAPEESWDNQEVITYFPGFYPKGSRAGNEKNVSFFVSILQENFSLMHFKTKKALRWLSELSSDKLAEMETRGLLQSGMLVYDAAYRAYEKIFEAFGLVRKFFRGMNRWFYPKNLNNLVFDTVALQIALSKPLDSLRLYLSKATLIVVPSYLIEHWKTQIQKVVGPGQLKVFIWSDSRKPPAHNLAWDYDVVITTFNRLSAEWGPNKKSVLTQVHWYRIMLDEGHTLGSSLCLTNKLQMAISLTACSRWILTGTPTPDTPNSQLAHLYPILKFLHEEAYGKNQETWDNGILRPFEAEMGEGRIRLLELLKRTMINSRKEDLRTLPPCIKKVTFLHFSEEHAKSYNELVATVRRNILMADWNDPSHIESLLNPKQWKFRCNTIRNIRLSCCVAGHIKVSEAGHDIQDTMDILVHQGLEPVSEEYVLIKSSLLNGGSCSRCIEWCRLPIITPCRHLLCLECVALDSKTCTSPGCGKSYEMQFPETRPENPSPKWPVPKDLIELQPSYRQDTWDPDWQSTSSSKVAYLVQKLKELEEANREFSCTQRGAETEISYSLLKGDSNGAEKEMPLDMLYTASCPTPIKVIIFSQFLEHIHVIEEQLSNAGIKHAGMYSPMHSSNKMESLVTFQHDTNCLALVMDGSAALGLDLSFVTHVFLMEPIWDKSMEEQVISRAHRMGATSPINVETLAMRGTIEEQMLKFLQDLNKYGMPKQDLYRDNNDRTQVQHTVHDFAQSNYLVQLRFVRMNSNQYRL